MNVIISMSRYVVFSEEVYPRYSVIDPREEFLSGLSEQRVHL